MVLRGSVMSLLSILMLLKLSGREVAESSAIVATLLLLLLLLMHRLKDWLRKGRRCCGIDTGIVDLVCSVAFTTESSIAWNSWKVQVQAVLVSVGGLHG